MSGENRTILVGHFDCHSLGSTLAETENKSKDDTMLPLFLYACFTIQPHTSELLVYIICNKDLELSKRCTSLALLSLIQHNKQKPHIFTCSSVCHK